MAADRILFIAGSRLGDAVLASGLVRHLVETRPSARFTIVGSHLTAPLFAAVPRLEELVAMEKRPGGGHWLQLWARLVRRRWALAVDMRGSPLTSLLQCDRRATARTERPSEHKVVQAARLLGLEADPPSPRLFLDDEARERGARLTAGSGPILAIAPGAAWIGKAWPAERFAQLAVSVLESGGAVAGGRLMLLGGRNDQPAADPLRRVVAPHRLIDLVARESLLTGYAALGHAALFVGNDSGLTHLAAAAGAPTLALFGPSDERLYAPWGRRTRVIRGPRPFDEFLRIDPGLNGPRSHMEDLGLVQVEAEARSIVATSLPEPARA